MPSHSAQPHSEPPLAEHRAHDRHPTFAKATICQDQQELSCTVQNVSASGALVEFDMERIGLSDDKPVTFCVPGLGDCMADLRWITPQKAGLEFRLSERETQVLEAFLASRLADEF
ncbi:PilZ domain-containing protein [Tropicibacter sp. R15_0]|uniref:PilZ domain-containing protein n=1 Tax=Tropicibacter sp. R15_0 TaxID=2821101 RepID=UPI001ADC4557|nr:PilZ domain-containing protein [Tropicibacter sp. R15_0]MBO9468179.1 PilZ domain-containing protein [Tropicibacter sp. R15_0]